MQSNSTRLGALESRTRTIEQDSKGKAYSRLLEALIAALPPVPAIQVRERLTQWSHRMVTITPGRNSFDLISELATRIEANSQQPADQEVLDCLAVADLELVGMSAPDFVRHVWEVMRRFDDDESSGAEKGLELAPTI